MDDYPFLYYGHGTSYYENEFKCLLWLEEKMNGQEFEKFKMMKIFQSGIPFSVRCYDDRIILIDLPRDWEFAIKAYYNDEFQKMLEDDEEGICETDIWGDEKVFLPTVEEWENFDDELNGMFLELHSVKKILFVIKPSVVKRKYGTYDDWHKWSIEKFSEIAWDHMADYYSSEYKENRTSGQTDFTNELVMKFIGDHIRKNKGNKKNLTVHLKMLDLLCNYHLPCDKNDDLKWFYYEPMMFEMAAIFDKLLPTNGESVEIIKGMKPFSQLIVFAGCEFPFIVLVDDAIGHLKSILTKIDMSQNDIICEYIKHILSSAFYYMKDVTNNIDRDLINGLIDIMLSLDTNGYYSFVECEKCLIHMEQWDDVIGLLNDKKWIEFRLLRISHPIESLKELIGNIPKKYGSQLAGNLLKLSDMIKSLQQENFKERLKSKDPRKSINEVKYGFNHNLTKISSEIAKLI